MALHETRSAYSSSPPEVFRPADYVSSLDLFIECTNLIDKDSQSQSDPCAVVYILQRQGSMQEIGRTETVKNTLNPKFARPIRVFYSFEDLQKVHIKVFDEDKCTADDELGHLECTLGQIITGNPYTQPLILKGHKKAPGHITIRACAVDDDSDTVDITFEAKKLDKKDVFSKSDPFLEILKQTPTERWQVIHRTEVVKNNQDPKWKPVTFSVQTLCNGNKQKPIKIDCYDHDDDGAHNYIGGFITTLEDLLKPSSAKNGFPCVNPEAAKKKKQYTNSGNVYISCQLHHTTREKTLLDYIFGGLQINVSMGIDFTQSNGDPTNPISLHYINPSAPNEYMQAIRAVGDICQDYDTDKMIPAFGFGAKIPPADHVSHDFPLNFNYANPNCAGINGVLDAYVKCLPRIDLLGPTIVSPIINHVAKLATASQEAELNKGPHAYHILLLLTDGIFDDLKDAREAIVRASNLPMSVIVIGIGSSDFSEIKTLSGDDELTLPSGVQTKRAIVQFVLFREFKQRRAAELASHILTKIPQQITDYFKMRDLQPSK